MNNFTLEIKNFDIEAIFTCGQCFRFEKESDKSFTAVALGRVINLSANGDKITFSNTTKEEFDSVWKNYFDMERDYEGIVSCLSKNAVLADSVEFGKGIRILRQPFFECMLSFIISANNNIPRIQKIINKLSEIYGEKIKYGDREYYAFPTPEALGGIKEEDLSPLRCGYRAKYIVNAVNQYLGGEICEEEIALLPYDEARKRLMKISGVGPKVADCILLFSFGRFEVFPTDVWVKRVMGELFGCDEKNATKMGMELFGEYAGIAQQYLFYKRRESDKMK